MIYYQSVFLLFLLAFCFYSTHRSQYFTVVSSVNVSLFLLRFLFQQPEHRDKKEPGERERRPPRHPSGQSQRRGALAPPSHLWGKRRRRPRSSRRVRSLRRRLVVPPSPLRRGTLGEKHGGNFNPTAGGERKRRASRGGRVPCCWGNTCWGW